MEMITPQQRKKILADPLGYSKKYSRHEAEAKNLDHVRHLHQQYKQTKKKLKDAQVTCKKLSRKIGEAKRSMLPVDNLLTEMTQQSAEVKQLKDKLSSISQAILDHFKTTKDISVHAEATSKPRYIPDAIPADNIHICLLQQNDHASWQSYIKQHPSASIYHRLEWKQLIQDVFGHRCYYFTAKTRTGQICGVLPLVRLSSSMFGDFMVSMPFFNYGGAIADSAEIEQALIAAANTQAAKQGLSHIEYRDDIHRKDMPVRTDKVNMILPLPGDTDTLWQNLGAKLRSQIKRAQREHHEIIIGQHDCLHDFYYVFARNMRDLGTPVYSKKLFHRILDSFTETSHIVIIKLDNRPVAGAFLLGHGEYLEIPWASTIRDVNHLSINMLLYWEVLKLSISQGYSIFDFGRSSRNAGTYRFKQQWGAQPQPCYWHYWLPEGREMPKLNPDNPKYTLAIRLWQKLPVWASKLIGPAVVRNLP